jgi:hypothetical protein
MREKGRRWLFDEPAIGVVLCWGNPHSGKGTSLTNRIIIVL